jgi:NAD(P)H-dependent FMN reductase
MHITIISGSHRNASQSRKVADFIATQLAAIQGGHSSDIIDLAGNPLPLWDGMAGKSDSATGKVWADFAARLSKADALVVISPEWAGMVTPGLKNFLLHASPKEVGHKPAMIVTVSAGRGGTYPVAELRTTGFKNNRMVFVPDHVIVQNVNSVLNAGAPADKDDTYIRARLDYSLRVLLSYGAALQQVRVSDVAHHPDYPFGM